MSSVEYTMYAECYCNRKPIMRMNTDIIPNIDVKTVIAMARDQYCQSGWHYLEVKHKDKIVISFGEKEEGGKNI